MKKISKLTVITTLITLLPIVLGIALYDRLPDVVATHWGSCPYRVTGNIQQAGMQ